jgi:hypothetical protein
VGLERTIDRKLTDEIADGAVTNAKVATDAAIAATKLGTGVVKATIIPGGGPGNRTVTGIAVGDALVAVLYVDFTDASEAGVNLTAQFSITAPNTIAAGADASGGFLIVVWEDRT